MPTPERVLEIRGLTKVFNGRTVLQDFDLDVHAGETVCVIGPSGSGKSTMLRCINRLEVADGGSILVEGRRMPKDGKDLDRLRSRLGMVFQQFNLFPHMSVVKNVMSGLVHAKGMSRAEAHEIAMAKLELVGLSRRAKNRPLQLSGGERQRVAIARALAMDPAIILFDEPTSSLDPELVRSVLDLMRDLASRDITMLVVTHEMGFARQAADKVVFMADGRLVEQGPPTELFDNPRSERLRSFLSEVL